MTLNDSINKRLGSIGHYLKIIYLYFFWSKWWNDHSHSQFLPPETPITWKVKEYKGINQQHEIYLRKRFLRFLDNRTWMEEWAVMRQGGGKWGQEYTERELHLEEEIRLAESWSSFDPENDEYKKVEWVVGPKSGQLIESVNAKHSLSPPLQLSHLAAKALCPRQKKMSSLQSEKISQQKDFSLLAFRAPPVPTNGQLVTQE